MNHPQKYDARQCGDDTSCPWRVGSSGNLRRLIPCHGMRAPTVTAGERNHCMKSHQKRDQATPLMAGEKLMSKSLEVAKRLSMKELT